MRFASVSHVAMLQRKETGFWIVTNVGDTLLFDRFSEMMKRSPSHIVADARTQLVMEQVDSAEVGSVGGRVAVRRVTFGRLRPQRASDAIPLASLGGGATRIFDVVIAVLLIICLLPVLLIVALLVVLTDPGPVFFSHTRQGKGGQSFQCLKFRSMVLDANLKLKELLERDPSARAEWDRDHKLRGDPRTTRIGSFLRRSSLDELPQLFNVLRGDMSLVGPRPIVEAEVPRYGRYISHYYRVRPGVTGLWQISGRNNTTYRRRVALDVMYTRRKNVRLNLTILIMTLPRVFATRGAY